MNAPRRPLLAASPLAALLLALLGMGCSPPPADPGRVLRTLHEQGRVEFGSGEVVDERPRRMIVRWQPPLFAAVVGGALLLLALAVAGLLVRLAWEESRRGLLESLRTVEWSGLAWGLLGAALLLALIVFGLYATSYRRETVLDLRAERCTYRSTVFWGATPVTTTEWPFRTLAGVRRVYVESTTQDEDGSEFTSYAYRLRLERPGHAPLHLAQASASGQTGADARALCGLIAEVTSCTLLPDVDVFE